MMAVAAHVFVGVHTGWHLSNIVYSQKSQQTVQQQRHVQDQQ